MVHLAEFRSEGLDTQSPCYNQLQKYLRHCTVFWLKWPVHDLDDLVLVTPPPAPLPSPPYQSC